MIAAKKELEARLARVIAAAERGLKIAEEHPNEYAHNWGVLEATIEHLIKVARGEE